MVMTVVNARAVQPFVDVVDLAVKVATATIPRPGFTTEKALENETSLTLTGNPYNINMVSVFVDGFCVINQTLDFGKTWSGYTISGNILTFNEPVTGNVKVFVDYPMDITLPAENIIDVKNVQGAKTKARNPGENFSSYFCKPVILTLPQNGYARLSNDHKEIIYVPKGGFEGFDAFSYTVITDRGQVADPKCAYVKVGSPKAEK